MMTTHYTMTIPVQAWRVSEDGSLPEEARRAAKRADNLVRRHVGHRSDDEMEFLSRKHEIDPEFYEVPERDYDYWQWFCLATGVNKARPGDWIVQTRYGLEAMTDERFRECCVEVGDDA